MGGVCGFGWEQFGVVVPGPLCDAQQDPHLVEAVEVAWLSPSALQEKSFGHGLAQHLREGFQKDLGTQEASDKIADLKGWYRYNPNLDPDQHCFVSLNTHSCIRCKTQYCNTVGGVIIPSSHASFMIEKTTVMITHNPPNACPNTITLTSC